MTKANESRMTSAAGAVACGLALLVAGAAQAQTPAQGQPAPAEYRIHAGDRLDISVWKETEMQRPVAVVSPDGRFSFPLVGQIVAAGKTVGEIRQEIETRLKKYIPEPVVTVGIGEFAGNAAYVIGQVNRPGALVMNPQINVLQALSLAGGGTAFAKLDNIIVIRGTGANQKVLPFRFNQVSAGKDLNQNVTLEAGDVVLVP
jgi:polysaccharide export outer membrane protein